jgi:hypothetical protein
MEPARKVEVKWRRTLRELLIRSGSIDEHQWLHRFLAERTARDHCLPSTVSELEKDKGIVFERKEVVVPGYSGEPARLMAYRVAPESLSLARDLLGLTVPSPAAQTLPNTPRSCDHPEGIGEHRRASDNAATGRVEAAAGV